MQHHVFRLQYMLSMNCWCFSPLRCLLMSCTLCAISLLRIWMPFSTSISCDSILATFCSSCFSASCSALNCSSKIACLLYQHTDVLIYIDFRYRSKNCVDVYVPMWEAHPCCKASERRDDGAKNIPFAPHMCFFPHFVPVPEPFSFPCCS
jgi:hypothetical protein